MCIIAIKRSDVKMFDEETIKVMFERNPDGAGYMYVDSGKVIIKKGFMDVDSLIDSLGKDDLDDKNVILHFRIGTSGLKDELNTHPYPIYDDNDVQCLTDIGVAHNGVLYSYSPGPLSKINDTQNFIQQVLSKLDADFTKDKDKLFLISKLIGTSKLAFLDDSDTIVTLGDFIEDDGYLYSNSSYKSYRRPYSSFNYDYPKSYKALSLFDDEEDEGQYTSFNSHSEMMTYLKRLPCIDKVDEDLYEDVYGNFYQVDHDDLVIYKF